jgi:hypothetical protein
MPCPVGAIMPAARPPNCCAACSLLAKPILFCRCRNKKYRGAEACMKRPAGSLPACLGNAMLLPYGHAQVDGQPWNWPNILTCLMTLSRSTSLRFAKKFRQNTTSSLATCLVGFHDSPTVSSANGFNTFGRNEYQICNSVIVNIAGCSAKSIFMPCKGPA